MAIYRVTGPEYVAGKAPGELIELDDVNAKTYLAGGWVEPLPDEENPEE